MAWEIKPHATTEAEFDAVKVRMRQRMAAGEVLTGLSMLEFGAVTAMQQEDAIAKNPEGCYGLTAKDLFWGKPKEDKK